MTGGPGENQTVLRLTAISKHFGGVRALTDVSFDLRRGEVHALVGENGAGKSTLIKIITGAVERDGGAIEVHGRSVEENDPALSRSLGVAAIYQQPALFPDLSVAENIGMRCEGGGAFRLIGWNRRRRTAAALLKRLAAVASPDALVRELAMAEQQLVEIACALGSNASILILDEPTASLSDREVENLFRVIAELKSRGVAMIYVSHRMEELFRIADRVTVLRDGRRVGDYAMAEMNKTELIRLMVGRELSGVYPKSAAKAGSVVLETRALVCSTTRVRGVSLTVRAGEIVGLAGLVGAGRTEMARTLFGLTAADGGEILLRGKRVRIESPAQAVQLGIAYVPEDRRRHGVILDMSVAANTTLAILKSISAGGLLRFGQERRISADWVKQLGTKTASVDSAVGTLSGGNQQKVALARWLATNPSVLILDEPTQGVDVGAKAEIHRLMDELAGRGLAIIMISSELPEILGMSDRIFVMHGGEITGELSRADATQEKVLELALGHSAAKGAA
ncbi:MAG TPA: sugar ABC transporter ATP-binding protein [Tepidisphaeraceae bacterium]|nr:sugar ABC transporter ATP-binding protein [Tepidisphaeraceae bacterium]